MKKRLISISLFFLLLFASGTVFADIYVKSGEIVINNNNMIGKASVSKGDTVIWYDLSREVEKLPTQLGIGEYVISLFKHKEGNRYYVRENQTVLIKQNGKFLGSTNPIYWDYDMEAIKRAKNLKKNAKTDEEKIKAIYEYVTKYIKYDWGILDKLPSRYVPDIEKTYKTQKGICYDYSALFAGMLRSVGIEAKLVKGYRDEIDGYHAWNEVFVNNEWRIIDTTYSAAYVQLNRKTNMYQNKKFYKKEGEF